MTEKELRKLGRAELLELLLEQAREFEALEQPAECGRSGAAKSAAAVGNVRLDCGGIAEVKRRV